MKIKRKFHATWVDLIDNNKEPQRAVRITLYIPADLAEIYRSMVWGVQEILKDK